MICKLCRRKISYGNICKDCLVNDIEREAGMMKIEKKISAMPNFIEARTVEEANDVDLEHYTLLRFSDSRNRYIFKRRQKI